MSKTLSPRSRDRGSDSSSSDDESLPSSHGKLARKKSSSLPTNTPLGAVSDSDQSLDFDDSLSSTSWRNTGGDVDTMPFEIMSDSENAGLPPMSVVSASSSSDDLTSPSGKKKASRDLEPIAEEDPSDPHVAVDVSRTSKSDEGRAHNSSKSHARAGSSASTKRKDEKDKDKDKTKSRDRARSRDSEQEKKDKDKIKPGATDGELKSSRSSDSVKSEGSARSADEMPIRRLSGIGDPRTVASDSLVAPTLTIRNIKSAMQAGDLTPRSESRLDSLSARLSSIFKIKPSKSSSAIERPLSPESNDSPSLTRLRWSQPVQESGELGLSWVNAILDTLTARILCGDTNVIDLVRRDGMDTPDAFADGPPSPELLKNMASVELGQLLSTFLRKVPEPLCTHRAFLPFCQAAENEYRPGRHNSFHSLIWSLPTHHRNLLKTIVVFVAKIALDAAAETPQARLDYLCLWLGPLIFRPRSSRDPSVTSPQSLSPMSSPRSRPVSSSVRTSPRDTQSDAEDSAHEPSKRATRKSLNTLPDDQTPPRFQGPAFILRKLVEDREMVFPLEMDEFFVFDSRPSGYVLIASSLDYLVEKLCDEQYSEPEFASLGLLTLNNFLTPEQLLNRLIELFEEVGSDLKRLKEWQRARRLRVLFLMRLWFTQFQEYLQHDKTFVHVAEEFISKHAHDVLREEEAILTSLLTGLNQSGDKSSRQRNLGRQSPLFKAVSATDLRGKSLGPNGIFGQPPNDVAGQMCLIDVEHLRAITPRECFKKAYLDPTLSPNFNRMVQHFNNINLWVQTEVVGQASLKHRVAAIDYFSVLAAKLLALNNFHSAFAVYTALSGVSISRLKQTWEKVSKKTRKVVDILSNLFSMDRNMNKYRESLQRAELPIIPCLTVFSKDLFVIEEAVENKTEKSSHLINIDKFRDLRVIISELAKYQACEFPFEPQPSLQLYLTSLRPKTEAVIYSLSLEREPRT